ncbi:hypothetical protein E2562_010227 [Oryza meyeriana var. granulata]|uniref:DUF834 domain-containing protein n=1 Tax=Oryza meyeriana var. granulata TaxID=110450 RepID=A0A6G1EKY4_9ORYZ|nr:hypothetical protein E2562_010227 [Oryza meyeriana var. granulata]
MAIGRGRPGLPTKRRSKGWLRRSLARAKLVMGGGQRQGMAAALGLRGGEGVRELGKRKRRRKNEEGSTGELFMASGWRFEAETRRHKLVEWAGVVGERKARCGA